MSDHSLHDIYNRVKADYKHVFVVPLIRYDFPKSDYLYLLYATFFNNSTDIKIHSTSALAHWQFMMAQLLGKQPILHYHWLEFQDYKSCLGMIYKLKMIWIYKILGGKLVWTIHNLKPHDGRWLKAHQKLHRWMAKKSDVILVHSKSQINEVSTYYSVSERKIEVLAHPTFPSELIPKSEAISLLHTKFKIQLDAEKHILGAFGAISEYKNLLETIQLLSEIDFTGTFVIFGYVKKGQHQLHSQLTNLSKKFEWLNYHPGFVSEEDIPIIMNSIDWCIFNFKEISTSGGVELAKAYRKRIIAPKKGILKDLESTKNVYLFSSKEELKKLLKSLLG